MILPRGVTGFNVPRGMKPSNEKVFVSDCWAAVASRGGKVEDRPQVLTGSPTSFVTRVLILPRRELTILLNAVYPWVGFCRPLEPGECSLEFLDPGRLSESLASTGRYRVLEKSELEQPVTEEMCVELGRAELTQLKYWTDCVGRGKMRVGDVVFNFWD